MVVFVWNNLSVYPSGSAHISRNAILEGHSRQYDLSLLRAFGTECYWMLTLQKKGGKKAAIYPKANAGIIVGIEDNMPAYRVYDINQNGLIRKIPFAQTITHEGHYPFRKKSNWPTQDLDLPLVFTPNAEAFQDIFEWMRYGFDESEEKELCVNVDPEVQGLNLAPKKRENKQESKVVPPRESKPPERVEVEVEASQDDEPSTQEQESDEEVIDLAIPALPQVIERKQGTEVESNVPAGDALHTT